MSVSTRDVHAVESGRPGWEHQCTGLRPSVLQVARFPFSKHSSICNELAKGKMNYVSAQVKVVSPRPLTQSMTTWPSGQTLCNKCANRFEQNVPVVTSFENRIFSPPVELVSSSSVDAPETIRFDDMLRLVDEEP